VRSMLTMLLVLLAVAPWAAAQDAVEVDPDHYQVALENDQVRVLLITYGPGEKSVMHEHPDGLSVFLTDAKVQFTMPDGTTAAVEGKAGEVVWIPGGHHLPENVGDELMEVYHIELKGGEDGD